MSLGQDIIAEARRRKLRSAKLEAGSLWSKFLKKDKKASSKLMKDLAKIVKSSDILAHADSLKVSYVDEDHKDDFVSFDLKVDVTRAAQAWMADTEWSDCPTCGGSGGGEGYYRCPACRGSGVGKPPSDPEGEASGMMLEEIAKDLKKGMKGTEVDMVDSSKDGTFRYTLSFSAGMKHYGFPVETEE